MDTPPNPRLKVIGVGNEWRGDDAVGLLVARRLKADQPPEVSIAECRGTVTAVREAWNAAAGVIVVDAVVSGGRPGAIYRFNAHGGGGRSSSPGRLLPTAGGWPRPWPWGNSSRNCPPISSFTGLKGSTSARGGVSQEVATAIPEAVRHLRQEIQMWLGREPPEGHRPKIGEQS